MIKMSFKINDKFLNGMKTRLIKWVSVFVGGGIVCKILVLPNLEYFFDNFSIKY